MKKIIIAIDGYSSTGKSTIAKTLAKDLNYKYIDTGAMYRAITLFAIENQFFLADNQLDESALTQKLPEIQLELIFDNHTNQYQLLLNKELIETKIRGMQVSSKVSYIAKIESVRKKLVQIQQQWGAERGIVMDGRDIGTTVFPNAEVKLFITATAEVRAERRYQELLKKGEIVSYEEILKNVTERDEIDSNRAISPLKPAEDAVIIDNSNLTPEYQYQIIKELVYKTIESAPN